MTSGYALSRSINQLWIQIHGSYFVHYLDPSEEIKSVEATEVIETGDGSAATWVRLMEKRDALRAVYDVVNS